jgi:hypothetical protein
VSVAPPESVGSFDEHARHQVESSKNEQDNKSRRKIISVP